MYYFAYGSNMSVKRMDTRKTNWRYRAHAVLPGFELTFDKTAGFKYATSSTEDSYFPTIWQKDATIIHKPVAAMSRIAKRPEFRSTPVEGYATIRPQVGAEVHGVVYVVPHDGITALDGFEGFPSNYTRELIKVQVDNGAWVSAYTYVAAKDMVTAGGLPSESYLAHLLDGRDMLPEEYFKKLADQRTIKDPYTPPYNQYGRNSYQSGSYYGEHGYGPQNFENWD